MVTGSCQMDHKKYQEIGGMMKEDEMGDIKDIYEGELIQIWEDEHLVYVNFIPNGCSLSFPKDMWPSIRAELVEVDEGAT